MSSVILRLRKRKEDRGLMANLRCYLIESKKQRAWPALHRLGIDIDDEVAGFIAALFATHPSETENGNVGTTWRLIERIRGDRNEDEKISATERRFQYLLSAEKGQEVFERISRMVLMAKACDIPVNYVQLEKDLRFWNDRTKIEWASAFWNVSEEQNVGEVMDELSDED